MNTRDLLLDGLKWRYATKAFDPEKKIPSDLWTVLEDALVLTPSSFGLQPWKFFVVSNPELRERLVALSWGQRQVADASHLVIFAVKSPVTEDDVHRHIVNAETLQGMPPGTLGGFEKVVNGFLANPPYPLDLRAWATRQVYLALGNFMTSAALVGVDTCPMEGLDPAGYDAALGLEGTGYFTVAACPAGYRAANDKYATAPKVRFPKSAVISTID